jgi:hypothetical protein
MLKVALWGDMERHGAIRCIISLLLQATSLGNKNVIRAACWQQIKEDNKL